MISFLALRLLSLFHLPPLALSLRSFSLIFSLFSFSLFLRLQCHPSPFHHCCSLLVLSVAPLFLCDHTGLKILL
ncbi:hypothetical protein B0H12DRAFT_1107246, partial [Mycena haematopus]